MKEINEKDGNTWLLFYELNVIYEIIYRVAAKNVMKQCFSNTQSH